MNWTKRSPQLLIVVLIFILISCNQGMNPSAATFTPLPEDNQLIPTSIETHTAIYSPTPTLEAANTPSELLSPAPATSTEEFSGKNSFGDGYIAHIPINDVRHASQEEIVNILVTQWLEHYKTESTQSDVMLKDYKVDEITLADVEAHKDNPALPFTAGARLSILPAQIPNEWAGDPQSEIAPNDTWWNLQLSFGVYGNEKVSQYYWLRIISYGG